MSKSFISYSHENDDKRLILDGLLKKSRLQPIVVARRAKPAMLLATKVEEALEEADFLIPILTEQSIHSQWVNQEIGYANKIAKERKIKVIPVVEESLILKDKLKGFIHKQMDLPFIFKKNSHRGIENKNFKSACTKLVQYLQKISLPVKYDANIAATFTQLNLEKPYLIYGISFPQRNLYKDELSLTASVLIENLGRKAITVIDIQFEINIAYPVKVNNGKVDIKKRKILFGLDYYKPTRKFTYDEIKLKHKPLIVKPNDIKNLNAARFCPVSHIPERLLKKIYKSFIDNIPHITKLDAIIVNLVGDTYKANATVLV